MRNVMMMALLASVPAAAQTVATTVQQDYGAATALTNSGKHAEALAAWEALERRTAKNPRSHAIAQVRKAVPLMRLNRLDEAAAATRAGLAALPVSDASLREDRFTALLALALIDKLALDYASSLANYRAASALATTPGENLSAALGEVRVGAFVDPDAALPAAERAEAIVKANPVDDEVKGAVYSALSELYLNLGRFDAARAAAGEAVKNLGGLTLRVNSADVAARSNYAIAALKLGRDEEARKYLAYTGAGRSERAFNPAVQLFPPECGADTGLQPDDVAVVEFSVNEAGAVVDSSPVYASRKGPVGLAFARSARSWSWTPEQLEKLPAFFRTRARVEMRCSTAFQRPAISDYLRDGLSTWLASKQVVLPDRERGGDAARLPADRARMASLDQADPKALALVPILYALSENALTTREETNGWARRALTMVEAAGAPPIARLAIEAQFISTEHVGGRSGRSYVADLQRLRTVAPYAGDVEARSALALMIADASENERRDRPLLAEVGSEASLPAAHPLKVGALVRLASLEQAAGDRAAAQAAFERSGLDAKQCALLDKPPALRSTSGNSFPMEAMRWGFEGWTKVQFDIDAKGKPLGPRAIISYPPFVFTEAGAQTMSAARFEESFRPDGGLGCGGRIQGVNFLLPG